MELSVVLSQIRGIILFDNKTYKEVYENKNSLPYAILSAFIVYLLVIAASFKTVPGEDGIVGGFRCGLTHVAPFEGLSFSLYPAPFACVNYVAQGYATSNYDFYFPLLTAPLLGVAGIAVYVMFLSLISLFFKLNRKGHSLGGFITLMLYSQTPCLLGVLAIFGQPLRDLSMLIGFIWALACTIKSTKETTNMPLFIVLVFVLFLSLLFARAPDSAV